MSCDIAPGIQRVLQSELQDTQCGWSVGSFGAMGEFHHDIGEQLEVDDPASLTRATARGAIRMTPQPAMQLIAYELLSPRAQRWSQGIAVCLPSAEAARARRSVLTELGPDTDPIRVVDRQAVLFDLGLAQQQVDFCIRTAAPELIDILRKHCGRPTFATPAGAAIQAAHPHRVVISNLGRAEVYQKIGGDETGGKSPEGPHTHVLPRLLAARRTHSANIPIPENLIPCGYVYPGNAVIDSLGNDRPFDEALHERFQRYLSDYGRAEYVAAKRAVWQALKEGADPASMKQPETRLARIGVRNALRQSARQAEVRQDKELQRRVNDWRAVFDRAIDADDFDDP